MKKKTSAVIVIIVVLLILLTPIRMNLKDGGSVRYKALIYEVIYTINNEEEKTIKYDTRNMDLISIKNNEQSYKLDVCYYDKEGNRYE